MLQISLIMPDRTFARRSSEIINSQEGQLHVRLGRAGALQTTRFPTPEHAATRILVQ